MGTLGKVLLFVNFLVAVVCLTDAVSGYREPFALLHLDDKYSLALVCGAAFAMAAVFSLATRGGWRARNPGVAQFGSPTVDAIVDSAIATFEPSARIALFRRAYQRIVDDAPAIWLYEPRNLAAVRSRLVPTAVRADAWLAGLPDWKVKQ